MNSKTREIVILVVILVLALVGFVIYGEQKLKKMHYTEINKVINERNGVVLIINKVDERSAPLKSNARNTVYKIEYSKDNQKLVAYYRATRVINDVHAKVNRGYDEIWLFY